MLTGILGGEVDAVTRTGLVREAEGNPLYLEELSRALARGRPGAAREDVDDHRPRGPPPAGARESPCRPDRPLSRKLGELASVAAAIGRTFPVAALEEIVGGDVGEA